MPFSFKPAIPQEGAEQTLNASSSGAEAQSSGGLMDFSKREGGQEKFSIIDFIIFALFGGVVSVTMALFGYSYLLKSHIASKKEALNKLDQELSVMPLDDMRKLSSRIRIINQLVKEHPSANVAFKIVEDSVENQITYDQFEMHYVPQNRKYALSLDGVAPNYRAIVQQIDTFKRAPYTNYLSDLQVQGLVPDSVGKITFGVNANIVIAGLLPEDLVLSEGAADRINASEPVVGTTTPVIPAIPSPASSTPVVNTPTKGPPAIPKP